MDLKYVKFSPSNRLQRSGNRNPGPKIHPEGSSGDSLERLCRILLRGPSIQKTFEGFIEPIELLLRQILESPLENLFQCPVESPLEAFFTGGCRETP